MAFHNYKTNKIEKIKAFCAVVECGDNVTKAAAKLCVSKQSVSDKIKSLEYDLKYDLFDRPYNRLILNKKGNTYYKEAKKMLNDFDAFYNSSKKVKLSKLNIFLLKIIRFYHLRKKPVGKKLKKSAFKFIEYFLVAFVLGALGFYCYLDKTNYFFDQKIYNEARPLLKQLIKDGHYRVSEDTICSFDVMQLQLDMYNLLLKLMENKKYNNMPAVSFMLAEHSMISMRFTDDDKVNNFFNDPKIVPCNTAKAYVGLNKIYSDAKILFEANKNFRIYNIYYKPENTWTHSEYFFDNIKKYPKQLFGIKAEKPQGIPNTRGWILKYNNYYYLLSIVNMYTRYSYLISHDNKDKFEHSEKHFFWKKLTLSELMSYDNGTYWRLIKDYNIKFN